MKRVWLCVNGQSNQQGAARNANGTTRTPFTSKYTGVSDPLLPTGLSQSAGGLGSVWPLIIDYFYEHGVFLTVNQRAIGGSGLINDFCGQVKTYSTSALYYENDVVVPSVANGHMYKVTTSANTKSASLFYIVTTGATTAGTEPVSWNTAGGTSTSGNGIVFTDIGLNTSVNSVLSSTDAFWDPLSLCANSYSDITKASGYDTKAIFIASGGGDAGSTAVRYSQALQNLSNYYRPVVDNVIIGLSALTHYPDKSTQYATLQQGMLDAFNKVPFVNSGPDLYQNFGLNLPMYVETDGSTIVHLTDQGTRLAASYMAPILYEILK